ncbi:hypothetical protein B484DRAFT_394041 [Ochromonadaceae sp. CCMP2298]|nr:hypothetical protein B484DRAFT_394041 [Ochromonadaceae sp. CCMP2298]
MALGPAAGALVLGVGGAVKGVQGAAGAVKSGAQAMQNTDSKAAYLAATKDQRHALGKAVGKITDGVDNRIAGAKKAKRQILAAARAKRAEIADLGREAAALKESEMAVLRAQVEEEERKKFVRKAIVAKIKDKVVELQFNDVMDPHLVQSIACCIQSTCNQKNKKHPIDKHEILCQVLEAIKKSPLTPDERATVLVLARFCLDNGLSKEPMDILTRIADAEAAERADLEERAAESFREFEAELEDEFFLEA